MLIFVNALPGKNSIAFYPALKLIVCKCLKTSLGFNKFKRHAVALTDIFEVVFILFTTTQ